MPCMIAWIRRHRTLTIALGIVAVVAVAAGAFLAVRLSDQGDVSNPDVAFTAPVTTQAQVTTQAPATPQAPATTISMPKPELTVPAAPTVQAPQIVTTLPGVELPA